MATFTVTATGGPWTTGSTWDLGTVPTATDDVALASTSGPLTISSGSTCRNMDASAYTNTLTHTAGINLAIYGSVVWGTGMTYTIGNTLTCLISFLSTSSGNTVNFAGKITPPVTFNGVGGGWTLTGNITGALTTNLLTVTNGSLNTSTYIIGVYIISSTNTNTRTVNLGSGAHTPSGLDFTISTGLSFSQTGSINMSDTTNQNFYGGSQTFATFNWTSAGYVNITGANTFATLNLTTPATNTSNGAVLFANQIVTGTFTCSGAGPNRRCYVRTSPRGTQFTITAATVVAQNADFEDIKAAGTASWDLSTITGRSGDFGGNSGITFSAPATYTIAGGNSTVSTYNPMPLGQDTFQATSGSISGSSKVCTFDYPRLGTVDLHAGTQGQISLATNIGIYGNWLSGGSINYSNTGGLYMSGRGNQTITTNGRSFVAGVFVQTLTGTCTLADNFISSSNFIVNNGTFNSSTFNMNAAYLQILGGIANINNIVTTATSTVTAGILNLGNGTVTIPAVTINGGTINYGTGTYVATNVNFSSGTLTQGTQALTFGTFSQSGGSYTSNGYSFTCSTFSQSGGTFATVNNPFNCTTFSQSGGTFTTGTAILNASTSWAQTGGSFVDGGGGITSPTFTITGTGIRSIVHSGTWTATGTGTVWNAAVVTNLTYTSTGSTIIIQDTSTTAKTFAGGTLAYGAITVNGAASNGNVTFSGAFSTTNWTFNPNCSIVLTANTIYNVGNITWNGTAGNLITVVSSISGTAATIYATSGTYTANFINLKDIHASGGGTFIALNANDNTNNSGWRFGNGGNIKVWNGSAWVVKPVKFWNGTAWAQKPMKVYNSAGNFVQTNY